MLRGSLAPIMTVSKLLTEVVMAGSKGRRLRSLGSTRSGDQVFWMSLEEAKRAIADKYEFLAERYERRPVKK